MENNLQIFTDEQFGTIRCYIDNYGTFQINVEDASIGLGFVNEHKKNDFTTSGEKYHSVRWARVNKYLKSFGYSTTVSKDDYIPENIFYRLAMKANNAAANDFQEWIANVVIPSIRRNGYYATPKAVGNPDFPPELSKRWAEVKTGEALIAAAKLTSDRKFREAIVRKAVYILAGENLMPTLTSGNNNFDYAEDDF